MRDLTKDEILMVAGGGGECANGGGNSYGGVSDVGSLGKDIIAAYEGLVEATSHIIERVMNSF